jgi:hypothetical protein
MDNRYYKYGCPGINIDSRNLTNYYSFRSFEQFIRTTNNLNSAQDYKNFLQMNGETIMNRENAYIVKNNTCGVGGRCNPRDFKNDNDLQESNIKGMDLNTYDYLPNVPMSEMFPTNYQGSIPNPEYKDNTIKRQSMNQQQLETNKIEVQTATSNSYNPTSQAVPVVKQSIEPVPVLPVIMPFKTIPIEGSNKVKYV